MLTLCGGGSAAIRKGNSRTLQIYTAIGPGLKIAPIIVLFIRLCCIAFVTTLKEGGWEGIEL
jgi:hypothetical protein